MKNQITRLAKETGIGLVAALTAAALVAGGGVGVAAQTQETETISARTGELEDDCNGFSLSGLSLTGDCRTSDTTLSRTSRSYDLSGSVTNNAGALAWSASYSSVLTSCKDREVGYDAEGDVELRANCTTDGSQATEHSTTTATTLNLSDNLEVNSSGEIVAK